MSFLFIEEVKKQNSEICISYDCCIKALCNKAVSEGEKCTFSVLEIHLFERSNRHFLSLEKKSEKCYLLLSGFFEDFTNCKQNAQKEKV